MSDIAPFRLLPLNKNGCGRDAEYPKALILYFNRPLTDDEMRFLDECISRAVPLIPKGAKP